MLAVDVLPLFHVVVIVPVGGFGDGFPLSRMLQFVAVWNWLSDVNVPLVTPPPVHPLTLPFFTMTFGLTVCDEPATGSAGLNVAEPELFVQLVPPAADAAPVPTT